jgi:hypothetical protein
MPNVRLLHFKTKDELAQSITPLFASQGEVIPWTWFDTQSYVSGTTTQLDFFQTVQSDKTLGNMQAAGQIPAPMYFDLYHLSYYLALPPSALAIAATLTPATGALNDAHGLVLGSVLFTIAQKSYFESKIYMCPSGGGLNPFVSISGTFAATNLQAYQFAQNGNPDPRARNNFWGGITIPHNQNFLVRSNWSAALTLANGNTSINVGLDGYLYRRVL